MNSTEPAGARPAEESSVPATGVAGRSSPSCDRCGHSRAQHSIDKDGKPYSIIDNLTHGPDFYCDSRYQPDPMRQPWSSCGCMGWVEPA